MATEMARQSPRFFTCRPSRIRQTVCIRLPDLGRIWFWRRITWSGRRQVRSDRTRERLASSDRGVVMLREIMMREIRKVEQGLDPIGVIRDPAQDVMIDTKLAESLEEMKARGQTAGGQVTALTEAERALGRS